MLLISIFSYHCEKFYKIIEDVDEICYHLLGTNQELGKKCKYLKRRWADSNNRRQELKTIR